MNGKLSEYEKNILTEVKSLDLVNVVASKSWLTQQQAELYKKAAEIQAIHMVDTHASPGKYIVQTYRQMGNKWDGWLYNPATGSMMPRNLDQHIEDITPFSYEDEDTRSEYERVYKGVLDIALFLKRVPVQGGKRTQRKTKGKRSTRKTRSTRRR